MTNTRIRNLRALATALVVAAVALIATASASAAGIAYIEGNNVRVSTLDGATKKAITADGADERRYQSVAQTVTGHVFASVGNAQNSLKQFVRFGPNGAKLSEYTAPYDPGWTSYAYPVGFEVSGNEANIAFGFFNSRFPIGDPGNKSQGTAVSPADHSVGNPPYKNPGVNQPTFFGNRIVGVDDYGETVSVQDAANAPYQDGYTPWLSVAGAPNIDITRVQIAPNGTTYAVEYTDTAASQAYIELHRHTGDPIPAGDEMLACDFPTAANPERVTFSPDSATMAWKDDQGVKVAPVPDLTAPGPSCPAPSAPTLISASGISPALGGITVQSVSTGPDGDDDGGGDDDVVGVTDTTDPETEKGKGPKRKTTKRKATFVFSSSESNSTFTCKLDKKPERACTSPAKVKKLKDGKHTFAATAIDAAGNRDTAPAVWKFKVKVD